MKKITKKAIMSFLKAKLSSDEKWAVRAMVRIYTENQTAEEQNASVTIEDNGIGFSGADAEILSSFSQQYISRGWLSPKQMAFVHKLMPKYWGQVASMSDEGRLHAMIRQSEAQG
jgi:hypothetical protein